MVYSGQFLLQCCFSFLQSSAVQPVKPSQLIAQLNTDLVPSVAAEISLLHHQLENRIPDLSDDPHVFPLHIHEAVDIPVDLVFQINDLADNVLHPVNIPGTTVWHITQGS